MSKAKAKQPKPPSLSTSLPSGLSSPRLHERQDAMKQLESSLKRQLDLEFLHLAYVKAHLNTEAQKLRDQARAASEAAKWAEIKRACEAWYETAEPLVTAWLASPSWRSSSDIAKAWKSTASELRSAGYTLGAWAQFSVPFLVALASDFPDGLEALVSTCIFERGSGMPLNSDPLNEHHLFMRAFEVDGAGESELSRFTRNIRMLAQTDAKTGRLSASDLEEATLLVRALDSPGLEVLRSRIEETKRKETQHQLTRNFDEARRRASKFQNATSTPKDLSPY